MHELDRSVFPENEFYIQENSKEDIIWDLVVVYEGVSEPYSVKCKKGNLIFISGEPPMSRVYPKSFLAQFNTLITQRPNLPHHDNRQYHPCMNWHLFFSFSQNKYLVDYATVRDMPQPAKAKKISMITSSKRMMPGHGKRMNFVESMHKRLGSEIDFFGQGIKFVDTKAEALCDFLFTISVENSSIANYWTEKFADPILSYTVPIYFGCTNIDSYFPKDSYIKIDINDLNGSYATIKSILENPIEVYKRHLPSLLEARQLLLERYNIFSELFHVFGQQMKQEKEEEQRVVLPSRAFHSYKYLYTWLRFKRYIWRCYNNISKLQLQ